MIEIKIANGDTYSYIDGNIATISADVITAIHSIYEQMREDSEVVAQTFKDVVLQNIDLAFCEEDKLNEVPAKKRAKREKLKNSKKEEVKSTLSEIVRMLDDGKSLDDVVDFLEKEIKK